jgi:hypothetical protein
MKYCIGEEIPEGRPEAAIDAAKSRKADNGGEK